MGFRMLLYILYFMLRYILYPYPNMSKYTTRAHARTDVHSRTGHHAKAGIYIHVSRLPVLSAAESQPSQPSHRTLMLRRRERALSLLLLALCADIDISTRLIASCRRIARRTCPVLRRCCVQVWKRRRRPHGRRLTKERTTPALRVLTFRAGHVDVIWCLVFLRKGMLVGQWAHSQTWWGHLCVSRSCPRENAHLAVAGRVTPTIGRSKRRKAPASPAPSVGTVCTRAVLLLPECSRKRPIQRGTSRQGD
jgi:hypothetical protein